MSLSHSIFMLVSARTLHSSEGMHSPRIDGCLHGPKHPTVGGAEVSITNQVDSWRIGYSIHWFSESPVKAEKFVLEESWRTCLTNSLQKWAIEKCVSWVNKCVSEAKLFPQCHDCRMDYIQTTAKTITKNTAATTIKTRENLWKNLWNLVKMCKPVQDGAPQLLVCL